MSISSSYGYVREARVQKGLHLASARFVTRRVSQPYIEVRPPQRY